MEFGAIDVRINIISWNVEIINKVWNVLWFTSNIDPYTNVCKLEDNYSSHQFLKNNLVEIISIFFLWFISQHRI
jgi:hypothetical protein